jgi:Tol biopolymer transport system component
MKGLSYRSLVFIFCFFFCAPFLEAATYYVRTDGGNADQCNGTSDTTYPGSGVSQPCAWSHPFWVLNSGGAWKIQGGDTLFIHSGSYQMGYGAPNTGWCEPGGAWLCYLPPLPSGSDIQNPTRILGEGWDSGCPDPPELWGTQRTDIVLNLTGTSNAVIDCLEITDHSGCVEFHSNSSIACNRDTYPFGDWALKGIYASDSSNIQLRHLNIHGLAHTGIHAGRLTDWTLEDVRIAGNGMAGWDGDIDSEDSDSGMLTFRRFTVEWNGCAESYPDQQPNNCWGQTAGGYGDGFGQGGETEGHWLIEDSLFRYNTSDGIDILYARGNSQIEIQRTMSYGNAGDQIKVTGTARVENCLMVSNCGYFDNKPFTYNVDNCRAGGSALVFALGQGNTVSVVNSTLAGQGDCLGIVECHPNLTCNGTETAILKNNIFRGYQEFGSDDTTCFVWFDHDNYYNTQIDYNVIYGVKEETYPAGPQDIFQNPLFMNADLENFDGHLQAGSPAIDSGLPVGSLGGLIPSQDITGASRPSGNGVDRGAYEFGGSAVNEPNISISPTTFSFGIIPINIASSPQTFMISNTGTADLIISSMSITGSDSSQFTLQTGTCPSLTPTISAGGSCTVIVTFSPTSEGSKSATLQIASNDTDTSTLNVSLSGTGGTQAADLPDLTGTWSSMTQTCKETSSGTKCKIIGIVNIQNIGNETAYSSALRFYLSNDAIFDAGDTLLKESSTGKVNAGASKDKKLKYKFPIGETASGKYVIALIDADNEVSEINENNNNIPYLLPSSPSSGDTAVNLTSGSAFDDQNPAFSPDGQNILFSSKRNGNGRNLNIWKMGVDGSNPIALTNDNDIDNVNMPGSSWNGTINRICYSSASTENDNDKIWIMDPDGGNRLQLTHSSAMDWEPTFSPDGAWIVFQSCTTGNVNNDAECVGGNWDIYKLQIQTGNIIQLTNDPSEDWEPNWSPAGNRIVFQANRDGNWDIYTMNIDGTDQRNITNNPSEDTDPSWSPDGAEIVYSSNYGGLEEPEIFIIEADGASQPVRITNNPAYDGAPSFSPDGSRIAFESDRSGNLDIWIVSTPVSQ